MKPIASVLLITFAILFCIRLAEGQEVQTKLVPFDRYGAINAEDASARLDNFAIQLQNQPDAIAVLVSYGPSGKIPGTASHVLNISQAYLVNSRGIEPNRVQIINAGRFKVPSEMFNELWIVPPGSAVPEPQRYDPKLKEISGKFAETIGWDESGINEGCCGPPFGDPTLAAFTDLLREQPKSVGYIVAYNVGNRAPGTWRRVAKRHAAVMQEDGIEASRIKIIHGGRLKRKADDYAEVKLQYWILPSDSPPPIRRR